jgi:hypothetical protein
VGDGAVVVAVILVWMMQMAVPAKNSIGAEFEQQGALLANWGET